MTKIGQALLRPVNKMFPALSGLLAIVWGIWLFLPKSADTLNIYTFLQNSNIAIIVGVLAIFGGLWLLFGVYRESLHIMSLAQFWLGVIWLFIMTFIVVAEWTTPTWTMYAFLAIYCFICTAVFSVQQDFEEDIYRR